jgi:ABC-type glycerol-3-phosphate transport system substrate-binding protein
MSKRSALLLCSLLALSACGKAKTGEGYTSGTCKQDVVEDYAEWAQECSSQSQRGLSGMRKCKVAAQDFLKEYPGVSCEIDTSKLGNGENYGGDFGGQFGGRMRIEHQTLEYYIKVMEQRGA